MTKYSDVQLICDSAIRMISNVDPVDSLRYARYLNTLAEILCNRYKYNEADSVEYLSLNIKKRILIENHPEIALSFNSSAEIKTRRGNLSESERLHGNTLSIRKKRLGFKSHETAQSYNNLGVLYYRQGKYKESEKMYQKALNIIKRIFGTSRKNSWSASSINTYLFV